MEDKLTNFLHWFLTSPLGVITKPPQNAGGIAFNNNVMTFTLFRANELQAELVIIVPGAEQWPSEHRHPDVDSYEVALFHCEGVTKNGSVVTKPDLIIPIEIAPGVMWSANCVRILPTDYHSIIRPLAGSALLSVQEWKNDVKPSSVGLNWEGEPVNAEHLLQLAKGKHVSNLVPFSSHV